MSVFITKVLLCSIGGQIAKAIMAPPEISHNAATVLFAKEPFVLSGHLLRKRKTVTDLYFESSGPVIHFTDALILQVVQLRLPGLCQGGCGGNLRY